MQWREYVAMRTFERVFSDLSDEPSTYGFNSWAELYDYIVDNNVEELMTTNGDVEFLISDYAGAELYSLLEYEYTEIKYIVNGVKKFQVDLSTLEE